MAKAPAASIAVTAAVAATTFAVMSGLALPTRARVGTAASTPFPFADLKIAEGADVGDSFLVPVVVADTIKDDAERAKAFKEQARKLSNSVGGAIRRYRKNNAGVNFAMRTVDDDTYGHGVRVWRVKDGVS